MKIDKTSQTGKADKTSGKKKAASTGDSTFSDMVSGDKGAQSVSTAQSIHSLDTLLAVQGAEDPAQKKSRQRMRQRAEGILTELENIKMGLLTGTLTLGAVIDVADVVASHREKIDDPRLVAILDEIDLRAQVEIAKARFSMK